MRCGLRKRKYSCGMEMFDGKSMNRNRKLFFILALVSLLFGCMKHAGLPEQAASETPVMEEQTKEKNIASEVKPEELKEGDRFIVVNQRDQRVITSVKSGTAFAGALVHGSGQALTYIPESSLIFSYEYAGSGQFRMKGENGWLTVGETSDALTFASDVSSAGKWEAEPDGTVLCVNKSGGGGMEKRYLFLSAYEHQFAVKALPESDPDRYKMAVYRLADDYVPSADDGSGYSLPVFETSDIHGYFAYMENDIREYRLARLAGMIEDARRRTGRERDDTVVLVDDGDLFQGNTMSNLLNGFPVLEAAEAMRYDAVTIGNHEFDWGIDTIIDRDATLADVGDTPNPVPVVMSNLYENGERTSLAKDYIILEKTAIDHEGKELPVKIGVLGFSKNYGSSIDNKWFKDLGFEIREEYDRMKELGRKLKETEGCDAVILLSHTDVTDMIGLVDKESDIDLILGGHSHVADFGLSEYGISYVQPIGNCEGMGYAELIFDADESGKAVFRRTAEPYVISNTEAETAVTESGKSTEYLDPEIKRISDAAFDALHVVLSMEIGKITENVLIDEYIAGSGNRSCTAGNWYADIYIRAYDADVAVVNAHGLRKVFLIPEGEKERVITVSDVREMFPFNTPICCYELTYEELLTVFQYAMTTDGVSLMGRMAGMDCYFEGKTINALVKDGETIYAHGKWYNGHGKDKVRLATNQFVATSNRNKDGMDNPLVAWFDTDRLIRNDEVDVEAAIRVLEEESARTGGYLHIDTSAHFLEGDYTPPEDSR